jgi:hypothetical protein
MYFAQYEDYNVGYNKNVYVTISAPLSFNNPLDKDNSLSIYYKFDALDSNYTLYNGAFISNIIYARDFGSLSLTSVSGQYASLNLPITTTNNGITFSFWIKSNS